MTSQKLKEDMAKVMYDISLLKAEHNSYELVLAYEHLKRVIQFIDKHIKEHE